MKKILIITGVLLFTVILLLTTTIIVFLQYGKNRIYTDIQTVQDHEIAIVFGAGLKPDGTPNDMLKDRLDTAAELYNESKISKFLLSGDNSLVEYNEPQAMYDYLVYTKEIPYEDVVRDFAGLRTYDTCARAKHIWGIDRAILISQGYHLSRAIFTCNALGVNSTGYSATRDIYWGEKYYKFREILAIYKAILDVYVIHPEFIGGELESDFR